MKKHIKRLASLLLTAVLAVPAVYAGNEQRIGQAGASELLINPWARSSALGDANIASITGFEGVFINVAGTAHLNSTQLVFSNTDWLSGAGIHVNSFGISQKVGDAGVLSLSVVAMNWGDIVKTTVENPNGDGSTFSPGYTNIGVSYAKEFSNSIYGGITVKVVNESIEDLKATGIAFDMGIQYITGSREQLMFGVVMKNVGPTMKMKGDGMSVRGSVGDGPINTLQNRSAEFELPSLIKLGVSYFWDFGELHRLTVDGAFTENSFSKNQFHGGVQYSYRNILFLRGGYVYEDGITDIAERTTALTGFTAGVSIEIPFKKGGEQTFAVDYSYRDTDPFNGVHSIGVRINL
jgi:hypothetical protein